MPFTVTVLGSAAMFQTRDRSASGYLLDLGGKHLWLDAGPGTWRNLLDKIDYKQIDGVLLTHRHPDHTTDVFQAYHARQYGQSEPLPKIPLWAPQETLDAVMAFAPGIDDAFAMRAVAAKDELEIFEARFTFHDMAHPPETVGVRVEFDGATFAYSSDTGAEADFSELTRDADVFVCEATFQESDGPWEGHLHASEAAAIASRFGVKRLVLTHLPPARDLGLSLTEAHRDGSGPSVELAEEGRNIEVGS